MKAWGEVGLPWVGMYDGFLPKRMKGLRKERIIQFSFLLSNLKFTNKMMLDTSKGKLTFLEKFARLNITHIVFDKIDLFLSIMEFLDDKDLYSCSKVCYFFQFTL